MAELTPGTRVVGEQVRDIISTSLTDGQVNAMINTAHLVVEQHLGTKSLAPDLLEQIELWLSAHFVCMRDPRKKQAKIDELSVTFQGEVGLGLQGSMYGQQAIALDPTGSLASTTLKRAVIKVE